MTGAPEREPVRVVLTTAGSAEEAERIATAVVEERLAACANVLPGVTSIYRWEGSVQRDAETLVVLKTTADSVEALTRRIAQIHPYDVPEVIALPVREGHGPYLDWVAAEVGSR